MEPTSTSSVRSLRLPIALTAIATALWCFAVAKAHFTSMTHDEASTYFHHIQSGFFKCFYSPDCWKSANNHLFNTLLWQQTIQWLGPTELGMRLPNLLGHLVFLGSSAFLVLRMTTRLLPGLAAFAVLNFNPFLLDFFSLARGYGLCAGFVMAAIAFWWVWQQGRADRYLVLCCAALVLAILSNFVAFNVFLAIAGATFLLSLREGRAVWQRVLAIFGSTAALLALILHRPIRFLKQGGEFQYGAGSLRESLESLIKDPLYGNAYLGEATVPVAVAVVYAAFAVVLVWSLWNWYRQPEKRAYSFVAALSAAFVLAIVGMIAQHYLLGSVYLVHRTIVPLMPLLSGAIAAGLLIFSQKAKRPALTTVLSVVVLFVMAWNLGRAANMRYFREWWYDENTKSVMLHLNDVGEARQKPVSVGVSWLFFPSGEFYRQTLALPFVEQLPNNADIKPDAGYEYYYIEESQKPMLGEVYEQVKYYPWGRVLMRKKVVE